MLPRRIPDKHPPYTHIKPRSRPSLWVGQDLGKAILLHHTISIIIIFSFTFRSATGSADCRCCSFTVHIHTTPTSSSSYPLSHYIILSVCLHMSCVCEWRRKKPKMGFKSLHVHWSHSKKFHSSMTADRTITNSTPPLTGCGKGVWMYILWKGKDNI